MKRLFLMALAAFPAFGVVTLDTTTTKAVSAGSNTFSWSHTVGSDTNTVMWVGLSYFNRASGATVSSVQLTGCATQSFTKLDSTNNANRWYAETWWLAAPTAGSCTVLVTFSASLTGEYDNQYDAMMGGAMTFFGAKQTTPVHGAGTPTSGGSTQDPSFTLTSTCAANYMVSSMIFDGAPYHSENAAGQMALYNGSGTNTGLMHASYRQVGGGQVSLGWHLYDSSPTMQIAATLFESLVPAGPTITSASCAANGPSSIKATWTTDVAADSQVKATRSSVDYESAVVNPVDFTGVASYYGLTSHSMVVTGLVNDTSGSAYTVTVTSRNPGGGTTSASAGTCGTGAALVSTPVIVAHSSPIFRTNDHADGSNGAANTGFWTNGDYNTFTWHTDGKDYGYANQGGVKGIQAGTTQDGFMTWDDPLHQSGTQLGCAFLSTQKCWANYALVAARDTYAGGVLSVAQSWGDEIYIMEGAATARRTHALKSTDSMLTTIASQHNAGPNTGAISAMSCSSGTVTATINADYSDTFAAIISPGVFGVVVVGATGSNVNGTFTATAVTSTQVSYSRGVNCTGWAWTSGGAVRPYFFDVPAMSDSKSLATWWTPPTFIHCDGAGYVCTPYAGMDGWAYAYGYLKSKACNVLGRVRKEDLTLTDFSKWSWYKNTQSPSSDDGLYDAAWEVSFGNATCMNPGPSSILLSNGSYATIQYLKDFNRFVLAQENKDHYDLWNGGSMFYDLGPYPWNLARAPIGDSRRTDQWPKFSQALPQLIPSTYSLISSSPLTASIALSHFGGGWDQGDGVVQVRDYASWTRPQVVFTDRNAYHQRSRKFGVGKGRHVATSLDLLYAFDVPTGSVTMPNLSPNDPLQTWAWAAQADPGGGICSIASGTDQHCPLYVYDKGAYNWLRPLVAGGTLPPVSMRQISIPTPYAKAVSGPVTVIGCFGHYPTNFVPANQNGGIALNKSGDLKIAWDTGTSKWVVTFKATTIGGVTVTDNAVSCLLIERAASNAVRVFRSQDIGIPMAPALGPTTVTGDWTTSALVLGDTTTSMYGVWDWLAVYAGVLSDGEKIQEMGTIRAEMARRGITIP